MANALINGVPPRPATQPTARMGRAKAADSHQNYSAGVVFARLTSEGADTALFSRPAKHKESAAPGMGIGLY